MNNEESVSVEERNKYLEEENEKLKAALVESQRREKLLMRRIHLHSTQQLDYVNQLNELKYRKSESNNTLYDPAINLIFTKLKNELKATKSKLEDTQNELTAWRFTIDSNTGKRLMAKCRLLYQENEELGKVISNGRLAKLETELALQKNMNDELKKSHSEFEGIIQDFDIDMEGLTSTIINLQQDLKAANEKNQELEGKLLEKKEEGIESSDEPEAKKICMDT